MSARTPPRVAYLTSEYPGVSHTFIRREVAALRRRGARIDTFALRAPPPASLASPLDREEAEGTWYVLPAPLLALLRDHAGALVRRPGAYLGTLREAWRHRVPGARAALWALFHFAEAVRLAAELERRGIDHLHTHFANAGGTVGHLAARWLGIGFSLTVHGSKAEFDYPAAPLLGAKVEAARFVACVSRYGRSQVMRLAGAEHWPRLFVSRCGLELGRFPAEPPGPAPGRPRIVCVGRLVAEKAQLGLVEATALLVKEGHDVELALVGEGPLRGAIERRVTELGLEGRCQLRGALPEEAVREVVAGAHVFALASLIEGLPVVLMEALALGVPVVAPRLSGIPELVRDGETGLLYDPGDWEGLARGLARVLEDRALAAALARRGRLLVEEAFDVDVAVAPLWARLCDV